MPKQLKDFPLDERSALCTVSIADRPDDQDDAAFATYADALDHAKTWSMAPEAFGIFIALWAPQIAGHHLHHLFYSRQQFDSADGVGDNV